MKKFLICICLLSYSIGYANDFLDNLATTPADAPSNIIPDFDKAVELYNNNLYEEAGDMFLSIAIATGEGRTMPYLAEIFANGLGVKKDCKKGAFFVFMGIKKGDCASSKMMAKWFQDGICTKQNEPKYDEYMKKYLECLTPKANK
jgi:TPR repeat protein